MPPAAPGVAETFDLAVDLARCRAATRELTESLGLSGHWVRWLARRYADPALPYHGAAHVGLLWLRHLLHEGVADERGMALALLFHDAVYRAGAADNEARSAALTLDAAGQDAEAKWAARAILATTDHLDYAGGDPRVLRLLDLDLTPLAERPEVFDRNTAALRIEAAYLSDAEWSDSQRRFRTSMLARAPLFRSGLDTYEMPARRNLTRGSDPPLRRASNTSGMIV